MHLRSSDDSAIVKTAVLPPDAIPARAFWFRPARLLALTCLGFAWPLGRLLTFAAHSELYSYILLIPLVAGYLIWRRRNDLHPGSHAAPRAAALAAILPVTLIASCWLLPAAGFTLNPLDLLALQIVAFVSTVWVIAFATLGTTASRTLATPLVLLLFLSPFPAALENAIMAFLQHGSVPFAHGLFILSGTSVMVDNLIIMLPGITLQVAPECSGIHSTLALFITSIVAADLFLHRPWKKILLVFAVIPLALLRNGFRVFVLGYIAVYHDPAVLDSPLHHQGGPIFFALSLIPFFILLYFLWRSDRRRSKPPTASTL